MPIGCDCQRGRPDSRLSTKGTFSAGLSLWSLLPRKGTDCNPHPCQSFCSLDRLLPPSPPSFMWFQLRCKEQAQFVFGAALVVGEDGFPRVLAMIPKATRCSKVVLIKQEHPPPTLSWSAFLYCPESKGKKSVGPEKS